MYLYVQLVYFDNVSLLNEAGWYRKTLDIVVRFPLWKNDL